MRDCLSPIIESFTQTDYPIIISQSCQTDLNEGDSQVQTKPSIDTKCISVQTDMSSGLDSSLERNTRDGQMAPSSCRIIPEWF